MSLWVETRDDLNVVRSEIRVSVILNLFKYSFKQALFIQPFLASTIRLSTFGKEVTFKWVVWSNTKRLRPHWPRNPFPTTTGLEWNNRRFLFDQSFFNINRFCPFMNAWHSIASKSGTSEHEKLDLGTLQPLKYKPKTVCLDLREATLRSKQWCGT